MEGGDAEDAPPLASHRNMMDLRFPADTDSL